VAICNSIFQMNNVSIKNWLSERNKGTEISDCLLETTTQDSAKILISHADENDEISIV